MGEMRIERAASSNAPSRILPWTIGTLAVLAVAAAVWWFTRPKAVVVQTAVAREVAGAAADRTVLNASGYVAARTREIATLRALGFGIGSFSVTRSFARSTVTSAISPALRAHCERLGVVS